MSDARLTPARSDLAAESLRGLVVARAYAAPRPHRITVPSAYLRARPDAAASPDTELLYGEPFDVYEIRDGWAWGQAGLDGYVGYLDARAVQQGGEPPTHMVATLGAQIYAAPKLKIPPAEWLPFAARVPLIERHERYGRIGPDQWVAMAQLRALAEPFMDWVSVAESFGATPYVWGGRSIGGLDCSALVQLTLQASGRDAPRDSDMQEAALGRTLGPEDALRRGDLIFWKGHVGIMRDGDVLLHANAYHMAVASELLSEAMARIAAAGEGQVTRRARLDPAPGST